MRRYVTIERNKNDCRIQMDSDVEAPLGRRLGHEKTFVYEKDVLSVCLYVRCNLWHVILSMTGYEVYVFFGTRVGDLDEVCV